MTSDDDRHVEDDVRRGVRQGLKYAEGLGPMMTCVEKCSCSRSRSIAGFVTTAICSLERSFRVFAERCQWAIIPRSDRVLAMFGKVAGPKSEIVRRPTGGCPGEWALARSR